jgi:kynurenine formamidase
MKRGIIPLLLSAFIAAGCAGSRERGAPEIAAPAAERLLPEGVRFVDLTYPFDASTLYWPTSTSGFVLDQVAHGHTPGGYFYASNSFRAPEHGGTHLDAPVHFAEHGLTADAVPIERLIAPAVVIDVASAAAKDADYLVTRADLEGFERAHGNIAKGTIVLLRAGWGSRWPDRLRYLGDDKPGDASHLHFPGLGEDAARALVARQVAAVGIDTASIDRGQSKDFIAHQVLLGASVPVFENVASMDALPMKGALVIALPMKIRDGSGGPLRIVALLPQ